MAPVTLGQAARLTGLGKTTITRAIKAGKLSASRREDGSYEIDPSELVEFIASNLKPLRPLHNPVTWRTERPLPRHPARPLRLPT